MERQTGETPPELIPKPIEPLGLEVWNWFIELNMVRSSNGFSAGAISFIEIEAYFRLFHVEPELWQVKLLKKIDILYLSRMNKEK